MCRASVVILAFFLTFLRCFTFFGSHRWFVFDSSKMFTEYKLWTRVSIRSCDDRVSKLSCEMWRYRFFLSYIAKIVACIIGRTSFHFFFVIDEVFTSYAFVYIIIVNENFYTKEKKKKNQQWQRQNAHTHFQCFQLVCLRIFFTLALRVQEQFVRCTWMGLLLS